MVVLFEREKHFLYLPNSHKYTSLLKYYTDAFDYAYDIFFCFNILYEKGYKVI